MNQFEVNGQTYRSSKMNARTQFHVLRRVAPAVAQLTAFSTGEGGAAALPALVDAISKLSDEATDYVLDQCLAVVERRQGEAGGWQKVLPAGLSIAQGRLQFADIDMMAMLQIVSYVLRDNYQALFSGGLAALSGEAKV